MAELSDLALTMENSSWWNSSMPPTEEPDVFYAGAKGLKSFSDWYKDYHGYLATIVCAFGIVANILNIVDTELDRGHALRSKVTTKITV